MKRFITLSLGIIGFIFSAKAQVDPLYAQYLNNPLLINPAYSGLNNNFNASFILRKQWAGFDGSPTTANVSAHSSLFDNKMGVGLIILEDKVGVTKNTEVQGTYAYRINVMKNNTLSFGLQAGMLNYRTNNDDLHPADPNAPEFQGNPSYTKPSFGTGVILSSERYLFGVSVPRLLQSKTQYAGITTNMNRQTFYISGAYVIFLTERIRIKPAMLIKAVRGAPISADLNFYANFDEKYTAGAFTRNFKTYGIIGQMKLNDMLRFGYVFEVPTNGSVGARYTSHEIMVGINMSLLSFHTTSITNF
jgi:type IX secretion system PorP/SprF family membrane protein